MYILKQKLFFLFLNICQATFSTEITTRQDTLNNGRKITYITSHLDINKGIKNILLQDIESSINNKLEFTDLIKVIIHTIKNMGWKIENYKKYHQDEKGENVKSNTSLKISNLNYLGNLK